MKKPKKIRTALPVSAEMLENADEVQAYINQRLSLIPPGVYRIWRDDGTYVDLDLRNNEKRP